MKLEIRRNSIVIIPNDGDIGQKDERDRAYIEEVLGLRKDGDACICRRRNVANLLSLAYIEIVPRDKENPDGG